MAAALLPLVWAGSAWAQTPTCSIALHVTSPADGVVNGQWSTSGCPTMKAQYEWKLATDMTWKGSHWTTATDGQTNRFVMKDLPPGTYDFRIATASSDFDRVVVVSSSGADKTYGLNDVIRVRMEWARSVTVTGNPRLAIDMDPADWGKKFAVYESGSGTRQLVFAHTVVEPNLSTQGIAVLANSLELNGGTIRHSDGSNAWLEHGGIAHGGTDSAHKVDWSATSDGNDTVEPPPRVPEYSAESSVAVEPIKGKPVAPLVYKGEYFGLRTIWSPPVDSPTGMTHTGYFVEWRRHGVEDTWQRSALLATNYAQHSCLEIGNRPSNDCRGYAIYRLVDNAHYLVRIVSQFTDSTSNTKEVVSEAVVDQVGYVEPMMAWFIDDTPNANLDIGRIFMMIDSNVLNASAICNINGGNINCPPRTLTSLDIDTSGTYNIRANATSTVQSASVPTVTVNSNGMTGCRMPQEGIRLSGSNNKLVVWWGSADCNDVLSTPVTKWKVQHGKPDGMGGTTWTTTEIDKSKHEHTFTGQPAGVHKVRVVPVSEADHDFDERNGVTITTTRCATAGDDDCTVKPTARQEVDGMSQEFSTILDASFTQAPDQVMPGTATAGTGSIRVTWGLPLSSRYYLGIEGYWPGGTTLHDNARSPVYRYDVRYRRSEIGDIAAGRWKQISVYPWYVSNADHPNPRFASITGLEDGLGYDVEIRAVNAVGPGAWRRVASALTVN